MCISSASSTTIDCPDGMYAPLRVSGGSAAQTTLECTTVPAGFYSTDHQTLTACSSPSTYSYVVIQSSTHLPIVNMPFCCSLGGLRTCNNCPAGYSCSTASAAPVECTAGFYSTSGSGTCTACSNGYVCAAGSTSPTGGNVA